MDACGIKLFTANIVEQAAKSKDSVKDQLSYHRALQVANQQLTIIKGYYSVTKISAYHVDDRQSAMNVLHHARAYASFKENSTS